MPSRMFSIMVEKFPKNCSRFATPRGISNAAAKEGRSKVGERGGEAEDCEDRTVDELRKRAKELGLSGYSKLRKSELIDKIRNH